MKRVYSALHSKSGQTIRIHSFKKFRRIIPSVKLIQNIFFSLRFFVKWYQMPAPKFDLSCWEIKKSKNTRRGTQCPLLEIMATNWPHKTKTNSMEILCDWIFLTQLHNFAQFVSFYFQFWFYCIRLYILLV